MEKGNMTFGFDMGTNSIGWAVVDRKRHTIINMGSLIFPMGVNLEKGSKEVSKNVTRREKRQSRRQYFRRRLRKHLLAKKLDEKGMFPNINELYDKYISQNSTKKYKEKFQELIQQNLHCDEIRDFFAINPYEMRSRAFEGKQLTKLQLGRVFYQMGLRRGYKETLQDTDDKGAIYAGVPKDNRTGIDETRGKIQEFGTLGNYLFHENPHHTRLRNRYTLRSMYTEEFDLIFENQKKYYPEDLTEDFYRALGYRHKTDATKNGVLFFQRPLRSQKHLLGNCTFETDKPLAPKSCPAFEIFRAWSFATNIREDGNPLSDLDQKIVVDYLLDQNTAKKFDVLRKKLSNPDANFNYDNNETLPSSKTLAGLKKVFQKQWKTFSEKEIEDLWHLKYWADDPDWLEKHLSTKYNLDKDQIKVFKKVKLADGYSSLSRKAIANITEFLQKGYVYDEAVLLAGIKRALGEKWQALEITEQVAIEDTAIGIAKDGSKGPSIERIKTFLKEHTGATGKELTKLYHHSFKQQGEISKFLPEPANVRNPIVQQALFELRGLYNELVDEYGVPSTVKIEMARELKGSKKERDKIRDNNRKRREINIDLKQILDQYGQSHSRENIQKLQLFKEIENRYGRCVNPFNPEQSISLKDLFGTGNIQIEHIIPQSRSLNNSLGNKTLCDADTNRAKGDKTPAEYYQSIGADWEEIKRVMFDILPYQKAKRFIDESNPDADEFISRQLNDTRYISKFAVSYLKNVCSDVQIMQGSVTSLLRHYWGLDGILTPAKFIDVPNGEYLVAINLEGDVVDYRAWDGDKLKTIEDALAKKGVVLHGNVIHEKFYAKKARTDHRHHAIDALVVALAERKHLQQFSNAHAQGIDFKELRKSDGHIIERPWEQFWSDAKKVVDNILVYHKANNRVSTKIKKRLYDAKGNVKKVNGKEIFAQGRAARGSLHLESVYGMHESTNGEKKYHIRKPIDFIENNKHLAKVVDKGIREAILERLSSLGVDVSNPKGWKLSDLDKDVKNKVFFSADESGRPIPQVFLKNKSGSPIPIKKVRIREEIGNAEPLKDSINQYVNPKNNHHVMFYTDSGGKIYEDVVTLWTAVERARQKQPVYSCPPNCTPWFSIEDNELFLLGLADHQVDNWQALDNAYLNDHLYRVQNKSSSYYVFRLHRATGIDFESEMKRIRSFPALQAENPVKVKLTRTGKISPW